MVMPVVYEALKGLKCSFLPLTFVRLLCLIMLQFKWSQLGLEVNTLLR